ncbi:MAG: hypothetical protein GX624_03835 [Actinobacteria bacterium]|nr:hypothetical protein [Actinomycetota bacterium]
MAGGHGRLTVDEAVGLVDRAHGLGLSREVLVDICESGSYLCRLESQGEWSLDADKVGVEDAARELMERTARLASEREGAEDVADEPPRP